MQEYRRKVDEMKKDIALNTQEVADMLKIAKNTVYELIKRGELNSYKVGRNLRFSLSDVEAYIENSKSIKGSVQPSASCKSLKQPASRGPEFKPTTNELVICGQDSMLDVLSNYLINHENGVPTLRAYIGSYQSLTSLYYGTVQVATSHLWDGDGGEYNAPFVRRLLPGIPAVIIHLTKRMQGFYVAKGNPKNIVSWEDFKRSDIKMVNREKGAGSRVLLDEHLRLLGIPGSSINGYSNENYSHLTVASSVARGAVDVGVGNEKAASQFKGLDFIPMQEERYEIVVKKEDFDTPPIQAILEILNSDEFKAEFQDFIGYDISEMGRIVAET